MAKLRETSLGNWKKGAVKSPIVKFSALNSPEESESLSTKRVGTKLLVGQSPQPYLVTPARRGLQKMDEGIVFERTYECLGHWTILISLFLCLSYNAKKSYSRTFKDWRKCC